MLVKQQLFENVIKAPLEHFDILNQALYSTIINNLNFASAILA